ncbi:hypothetical protein [Caballeronia sp. INSB1]|uniref:hypothetical protein n=1 Tax=Caballeronia sp. INSB1 TaxID=2921751 RepID=UPI002032BFC4|nr:hypothetical protein [Caballeronia sp. INSB1]
MNGAQKVRLTIDTLVNARAVVPLLDDFQSSYDARAAIGMEHGIEIAKFFDQSFFIQAIKAAGITDMTQYPAGWQPGTTTSFNTAGDELDPVKLEAKLLDMFAEMADKDVDPHDDGLVIVTKPKYFYTLLQNQRLAETFKTLVGDAELCNAAILGAATKFLKDNNITAVVEDNSALSDMQKKIQEMQARRKQRNVVPMVPASEVTDAEAAAAVEQAIAMNGS